MPPRFGPITERQTKALTDLGISCEHLHYSTADTLLEFLFRGSFGSENPVVDEQWFRIYKQKQIDWVRQYAEIRGSSNPALRTRPTRGEVVRIYPKPADFRITGSKSGVDWSNDANWAALLLLPNKGLKSGASLAGLIPAQRLQPKVNNNKRRKRS